MRSPESSANVNRVIDTLATNSKRGSLKYLSWCWVFERKCPLFSRTGNTGLLIEYHVNVKRHGFSLPRAAVGRVYEATITLELAWLMMH